jgi:predicted N-acetyltransferase YhbS
LAWLGECQDLRQHPYLLGSLVTWLHKEWLKRAEPSQQDAALAYQARYQQMQLHLGKSAVPMTLVAVVHNKPVGCISLTRLQAANPRFASGLWMTNLFVVPEARKQGVASALLVAAQRQAQQLNETVLYLFTDSAADFYRRRGWQQCLNSAVVAHTDNSVCVFKKNLAGSDSSKRST